MTPAELAAIEARLEGTRQELLAEVLRRCMGIDADDNARHDFGDMNGGSLQRPTEVAAELLRALNDEGLTVTQIAALVPASEGEPTDMEPCDICDIRGGHDVHCIRYPHSRPKVTVIWKTAADRAAVR